MSEILAPCGGYDSLIAAIRLNADAVYVGSKTFSARQNAKNFDKDELKLAVEQCHLAGVKIYQAINTVILEREIPALIDELEYACEIGIDGLITQDLSLVYLVKRLCPNLSLHSSTQMTIHTKDGVLFMKRLGFSRVVLSRELDKETIKSLCNLGIEIECFVHGALCMSVSGQCLMSSFIGTRSANRGLCAGACRLPFGTTKKSGDYLLSLKDMCLFSQLKEMEDMGVTSFKIEGRMKRPEYVALAASECTKARNGEEVDKELLQAVFSRSGFTEGYYKNSLGHEMFGTRQKADILAGQDALPNIRELYRKEVKKQKIDFDIQIQNNKPISLTATTNGFSVTVEGNIPEKAINKPTTVETINKQLGKLGDTIYYLGEINAKIDDGLVVPVSKINELRREIIQICNEKIVKNNTPVYKFSRDNFEKIITDTKDRDKIPTLRISLNTFISIGNVIKNHGKKIESISIPLSELILNIDNIKEEYIPKLCVTLPRFIVSESDMIEKLKKLKEIGIKSAKATNLANIKTLEDLGFDIHTDFGFNITNSFALSCLNENNIKDSIISLELTVNEINEIKSNKPLGAIVYGYIPLMLTRNCPIYSKYNSCADCEKAIYDRLDEKLDLLCHKRDGYVEILNSKVLYMFDRLREFKNIDFFSINFTKESDEEIQSVINAYFKREKLSGEYTRGLYQRGVL